MADRPDPREPEMDASALYREETITDRRVGTIRMMTPITPDGSVDENVFAFSVLSVVMLGALGLLLQTRAAEASDAVR